MRTPEIFQKQARLRKRQGTDDYLKETTMPKIFDFIGGLNKYQKAGALILGLLFLGCLLFFGIDGASTVGLNE